MLFEQFKKNIIENDLIKQGDRVVAGVSGGADSVCLLLCLHELSEEMPFILEALHLNHCIRGAFADADEAFTVSLCESLGIKLHVFRKDVQGLAKEKKISVEEAGRQARYEALFETAGGGKIAVAHNRNDLDETIFHNIIRGSSLPGLSGMKMKEGAIIRPLLNIDRTQIEEYLAKRGQEYCTDATNFENEYTRNKLRNIVIPFIEKEINTGFSKHLRRLGRDAELADEYISDCARAFLEEHSSPARGGLKIDAAALLKLPEILRRKAVYLSLAAVSGKKRDIGDAHVGAVIRLLGKDGTVSADLPYGVTAVKSYHELTICKNAEINGESESEGLIEKLNRSLLKARIFSGENAGSFPQKEYTKWFDYDKITDTLLWRTRRQGDGIFLKGVGRKSLARYMIDEKIPAAKRDATPVLADGNEILWIPGGRINEKYKITSETKNIIEINAEGDFE